MSDPKEPISNSDSLLIPQTLPELAAIISTRNQEIIDDAHIADEINTSTTRTPESTFYNFSLAAVASQYANLQIPELGGEEFTTQRLLAISFSTERLVQLTRGLLRTLPPQGWGWKSSRKYANSSSFTNP